MGDFVPSWLVCGGRLFRVCRVSIRSCRSSVPSFIVGFGESWCQCVGVVGLEDVKETMDIWLDCCCFDGYVRGQGYPVIREKLHQD